MKRSKLDKPNTPSTTVAPQDVDLGEDDDDGIDVVEVDVKVEGEQDNVKMERERWSEVWNFYEILPIGSDGRERAQCGSFSINSTIFKPERFRELVSEAIVKHDLPFKFVEYDGIREIFRYLNEKVITVTRNTAKADVLNLFKKEKMKLKKLLELLPGRISLTSDLWSSINTDGFLCVTSHFIDEEWKLQKRILNFQYMPPPSNEEWGKLEKIFKFLEVFYEVTCIFSGNKYCTTNLYFPSVSTVERTLREEMENSDTFMKNMACKMYEKFSKYWSEYSLILAMAAVLDPRYKMQYVEFTYKKLYGSNFLDHSQLVRDKLKDLFTEYAIESHTTCRTSTVSTSDSSKSAYEKKNDTMLSKSTREMLKFTVYETKEFSLCQKSQLDMYLDEPRSDISEDINVLSFWKAHQYRYPELACMARDILSIPVSTVASESAFSNGGRVLDQYRSSLKHENVEALICTKDWLFGMKGDEELCLQDLTDDIMEFDSKGTHEAM